MEKIIGDRLSKAEEIDNIVSIIKSCLAMSQPMAFSIEGEWGKGKTWTVNKISDSLNGIDITNYVNKPVAKNEYFVINFNAWEKDYYNEPLLAIMATIINQLKERITLWGKIETVTIKILVGALATLEKLANSLFTRLFGVDIIDINEHVKKRVKHYQPKANKVDLSQFQNIENDIIEIVKTLNEISNTIPIVFIVDELDRCIPNYAIKTLERLHHIFGKVNHSVTIISVYRNQLEASIKEMFGTQISPEEYLRKFLNFRVLLHKGKVDSEEVAKTLKDFKSLFATQTTADNNLQLVDKICDALHSRDFESICKNALLCHRLVNMDTTHLPACCMDAEILLYANKLAQVLEGNPANTSPKYGNSTNTPIGTVIKTFLLRYHQGVYLDNKSSTSIILFICNIVLGFNDPWANDQGTHELDKDLTKYYTEYKKYYDLIK